MEKIDFIVSVTSFGERIQKLLYLVLNSLKFQTNKNFKVCLTLNPEDIELFDKSKFPDVEIIVSDLRIKSHLKYFETMKKYHDMPIITIDDDTYLPPTAFEELWNDYKLYGDHFVFARQVVFVANLEDPININRALNSRFNKFLGASHNNFAEGFCGVLYPPNCFKFDESEMEKIKELLTDDDIYLKGLEIRQNKPVKYVLNNIHCFKQLDLFDDIEKTSLHYQFNSKEARIKNFQKISKEILPFIS